MNIDRMVGAAIALIAALGVTYAALQSGNEQALGALVSLVSAAAGYYLRGRVEPRGGA